MRKVWYRTFWAADDWFPGFRRNSLEYFLLDIPYFMDDGVIPPLQELNKVLSGGGGSGGMSPGTVWKPFQIDEAEYKALVEALLGLDVETLRKKHPFIRDDVKVFVVGKRFRKSKVNPDWRHRVK